jgi:hypothetical protein
MPNAKGGGLPTKIFDLRGRCQRSPYGMVAGAVAIGFVLGGGLFTRLTSRIVGSGLRIALMAALPSLQEQITRALTGPKVETKKENDQ